MFEFCSLVSGSSGNCLFIQDDNTKILIDCGVSGKNATELLKNIGVNITDIDAILVTHEHSDHISGVGVLSRKLGVPVYANQKTWAAMPRSIGEIKNQVVIEDDFQIKSLNIHPFSTPHDAASSCGYNIYSDNKKITIATDLGHVDHELLKNFSNTDFAFIESNHDVEMLVKGPYPYPLKQRILSDFGHLSNKSCADLAVWLVQSGTYKIMLGHLSNENNSPDLAYNTVSQGFNLMNIKTGADVFLDVANRFMPSQKVKVS